MSNISKIKISGTSYNIKDENACNVVELTQAQYDALPASAKTSNSLFVITDAQGVDLSNYYTKTETDNAITAATSTKQDTLVSGTNIKTINNQSILGEGNITIEGGGGGSITIDPSLDSGSTNPVANSAITTAINDRPTKSEAVGGYQFGAVNGVENITLTSVSRGVIGSNIYYPSINGKNILTNNLTWARDNYNFQLVETSAFTVHTADTVIHVTSDEKAAWNAKSDFSGDYNDLANKPTIPTVPTSNTAFTNDAGYITSDAISGKVDTSTYNTYTAATDTALATKQTTLTAGTGISIVDNVISATGGGGSGKAFSAGTNISITTGETADTINCTLPIETISNPYGVSQIYIGDNIYKNNNYEAIVIANKDDSSTSETRVEFAHGAISIGSSNKVFQDGIAIGQRATAGSSNSWGHIAIGVNVTATGSTKTNINDQIKVDANNQVYISNSANTSTYCLQEKIENTESALGGLSLVKLTQSEYDALATKGSNTLYIING